MGNELSLYEIIQRQIAEQKTDYKIALKNGKSVKKLTEIQDKINYLQVFLLRLQNDFKSFSQN